MRKTYHNKKKIKQVVRTCEIDGCEESGILEIHHIIPQREKNTNENFSHGWTNLVVVCPNHHAKIEQGEIIIEGRYRSTEGYTLIYHEKKSTHQ